MYCAASYGCEYIFYAPSIEDLKIIVDKMIHQRTHLTFVIADFLWMYYDCDTGILDASMTVSPTFPKRAIRG